jgi:orotidine-5'-phosphate decarboxylase
MDIRPHRRIVLPLDVPSMTDAVNLASDLHEHVGVMKVGLELFMACGTHILSMGQELGLDVFLDLKLHDIPNTVAGAVRRAAELDVQFLTVHASGGPAMLKAAVEAAPEGMTVLAVTVLTSLAADDLERMGVEGMDQLSDRSECVRYHALRLARMARECGVRGFVCSPLEVGALRQEFGPEAVLVVPGIRPAGSDKQDQSRVATPAAAVRDGADYIVVGRPIREAEDPVRAARTIAEEIRPFT